MEIFVTAGHRQALKEKLSQGNGSFAFIRAALLFEAENRFKHPLYSVTFTPSKAASGDPHDYYSEAPYWWPDPQNPDGPFIRRDGEIYPGRFCRHTDDMSAMADDVYLLSAAGYLLDRPDCTARANALLKTWFLDADTKMNPNLNCAQAIYKVTKGRGIGIIDTTRLILVVAAMDYFALSPEYAETVKGLQAWFADYFTWLDTSKNGIDERDYFNNHANWWNTQAAAFSAFCGDSATVKRCAARLLEKILPEQTGADGSFTDELTRTNSFTYSLYNLDACAVTAEVARGYGMDLWNTPLADGRGIRKSLDYLYPFYKNPFLWERKQITGKNISAHLAFQLASVRVDPAYGGAEALRRDGSYCFASLGYAGPLCFLEGYKD